ncbi:MAG: MFS transporter [Rhodospirillales bacterium]|nr:MFS transporter [Rhodospirillales bacterium]
MSTVSSASSATTRRITVIICLAEILGMTGFAAFPTLLPLFFTEWSITNTEAGWINGIYYAGYVAAVVVLTSLTDRIASRDVYLACTIISGIAIVGFALFADGFWSAMVFRTLGGIGLAGTYMPGLKMLSDFLNGPKQSRNMAFYTASFGIGASVSIAATGLIASITDWRTTFIILSIGPLLALLIAFFMIPRRGTNEAARPNTHLLDFRPVLRSKQAMGFVLAYTVHNFELFAYRAWTVAFLVYAAARHPDEALPASVAMLAAMINLFGVPASILGNECALHLGRHRWITMVMITSALLAAGIGFTADWPLWVVVVLMCLYSMTVAGESASVTAGAVESAPQGYRGATMAVHSSIAFSGAFLGPLAFGIVLDQTGGGIDTSSWGMAFLMLGAVVITGPLLLRWSRRA